MDLYSHRDSLAASRVRIAFRLKGIPFHTHELQTLREDWGETRMLAAGLSLDAPGPVVVMDGQRVMTQSLAAIEYLDDLYPDPPLMPADARGRARVRSLAQLVACDVQPLEEPRVQGFLAGELGLDAAARQRWREYWLQRGLMPLEHMLRDNPVTGIYCHGDSPTLADICLVPLLRLALAAGVDPGRYPTVARIHAHCLSQPAFAADD